LSIETDNLGFGIGFKHEHFHELFQQSTLVDWIEVHPENYMHTGGMKKKELRQLSEELPLSMHGVGMSLGSPDGVCKEHLKELSCLVQELNPVMVSEHLAWSHWNEIYINDLLPLPYTEETISVIEKNILFVQETLGRHICIENPSSYLHFDPNLIGETDFINEIVRRTECGVLLDLNNVFISSQNQNFSPYDYIGSLNLTAVREIHLAGHVVQNTAHGAVLIDTHSEKVCDQVWKLYAKIFELMGKPIPTLIEWDNDIPTFSTLMEEIKIAKRIVRAE
jgi:uncharacterized protein